MRPPKALAPRAIHKFLDNPKVTAEILPPKTPINRTGFRPNRSLILAQTSAIKNSPKVKKDTVKDA
jgi:hypothetical protein